MARVLKSKLEAVGRSADLRFASRGERRNLQWTRKLNASGVKELGEALQSFASHALFLGGGLGSGGAGGGGRSIFKVYSKGAVSNHLCEVRGGRWKVDP